MRRKYTRQHLVEAQIEIEEIQEAGMCWFPVGFAFIGLVLHIFPPCEKFKFRRIRITLDNAICKEVARLYKKGLYRLNQS